MEKIIINNVKNLLAAKASTQPLSHFPVDQLPDQFTFFDASRERGDGASRETIRKMISRWTKRGLCKKVEGDTEMWQKVPVSA